MQPQPSKWVYLPLFLFLSLSSHIQSFPGVLHGFKHAPSFFLMNTNQVSKQMRNNSRDCVDETQKWKYSCPKPSARLQALNDAIHSTRRLAAYTAFSHSESAKRASMLFCPTSFRAVQSTEHNNPVSSTNASPVKPALPHVLWWTSSLCGCAFPEWVSEHKAWISA